MAERGRGRPAGGTDIRARLMAIARRRFADFGYDRTSLRAIAAEAAVDPKLVSHYFGSKQGLFVAVQDFPLAPEVVAEQVAHAPPGTTGRALAELLLGVLAEERAEATFSGLIRAAVTEPAAARLLRERLGREMLEPIARAIGSDRPELRASLVASHVVGLAMARVIVGIEPLASTPVPVVVDALAPVLEHYLTGDLGSPSVLGAD